MKKIHILLFSFFLCSTAFAQTNPDGTEYGIDLEETTERQADLIVLGESGHLFPSASNSGSSSLQSGDYKVQDYSGSYKSGATPIVYGPPGGFPTPTIPIDGGVGLLIVAGVGYGLKRMRDSKK